MTFNIEKVEGLSGTISIQSIVKYYKLRLTTVAGLLYKNG